jgi:hypothetical protein
LARSASRNIGAGQQRLGAGVARRLLLVAPERIEAPARDLQREEALPLAERWSDVLAGPMLKRASMRFSCQSGKPKHSSMAAASAKLKRPHISVV